MNKFNGRGEVWYEWDTLGGGVTQQKDLYKRGGGSMQKGADTNTGKVWTGVVMLVPVVGDVWH